MIGGNKSTSDCVAVGVTVACTVAEAIVTASCDIDVGVISLTFVVTVCPKPVEVTVAKSVGKMTEVAVGVDVEITVIDSGVKDGGVTKIKATFVGKTSDWTGAVARHPIPDSRLTINIKVFTAPR